MNFNEVKELISIVDASSFKNFELTLDNCNVKMSKTGALASPQPQTETITLSSAPAQSVAVPVAAPAVAEEAKTESTPAPAEDKSGNIVKAPLVGTFYESPGPGKPVYAPVGTKVKKGDVLCIIEAMKLMNEIAAEVDGVISEVCVTNGQIVEFGTELFRIKR